MSETATVYRKGLALVYPALSNLELLGLALGWGGDQGVPENVRYPRRDLQAEPAIAGDGIDRDLVGRAVRVPGVSDRDLIDGGDRAGSRRTERDWDHQICGTGPGIRKTPASTTTTN